MPKRAKKAVSLDRMIKQFLRTFARNSHAGDRELEGSYYWNERDVHWELFNELRRRTQSFGLGSRWWVHAEGRVERPKWAHWHTRRSDVVVINHKEFIDYVKGRTKRPPPYEAMIEVKVLWRGYGKKVYRDALRADATKLSQCLRKHLTKEAHLVILDSISPWTRRTYLGKNDIVKLKESMSLRGKLRRKMHIWHWPDSEEPIQDPAKVSYAKY